MAPTFRYYCIMRPPMPGGLPHPGLLEVEAFAERRYVPEIDRMAWGWADYVRELAPAEVSEYELIAQPREGDTDSE